MERKLLIEVLSLLKTMGTLKVLDTNKVTTLINKIETTLYDVEPNGGKMDEDYPSARKIRYSD
jgi:hypothetical protein|tara:strand:+ start:351 stop:539 length:189 start_codon:yes stop_codon:yes gene_type:complete